MATFPASKTLRVEHFGEVCTPTSMASDWFNCTLGLNLNTAPVYAIATAIGPDSSYTLTNTIPFSRDQARGTNIMVRMVYDHAHSAVGTPPQYALRGRRKTYATSGSNDATAWQYLPNRNATPAVLCTLTPDLTNDIKFTVGSATLRATTPSITDNVHDCLGCDEFELVPITAIAATGGTYSLDRIEVKIF